MYALTVFLILLCGLCSAQQDSCSFFGDRPIYPYYHPQALDGKDFYTLKHEFRKAINAKSDFDGIITVIFFINNKGETGLYRLQLCSNDYAPLEMDSSNSLLCDQVLQAVKQSGPLKPRPNGETGMANYRKFYSFRFKQGSLVEILPK